MAGGGLANPADQFPRVFDTPLWRQYPYALATFVAGALVLSSAATSLLFLKETLKRKSDGASKTEPPMTTWEVLKAPGVAMVLYIQGHTMLLSLSYTAVSPVFMYTNVRLGGFGFSDQQIAMFLAIAGASQAFWILLVFPPLQKKFSTGTVLRGTAMAWPFFMAAYPILNEFLRNGWTLAFWIITPIAFVIGSGVAMVFGMSACRTTLHRYARLTDHSRCTTLHQRHLALSISAGDRQCVIAHCQQRRSRFRSCRRDQHLCCGYQIGLCGRSLDLVRPYSVVTRIRCCMLVLARESGRQDQEEYRRRQIGIDQPRQYRLLNLQPMSPVVGIAEVVFRHRYWTSTYVDEVAIIYASCVRLGEAGLIMHIQAHHHDWMLQGSGCVKNEDGKSEPFGRRHTAWLAVDACS